MKGGKATRGAQCEGRDRSQPTLGSWAVQRSEGTGRCAERRGVAGEERRGKWNRDETEKKGKGAVIQRRTEVLQGLNNEHRKQRSGKTVKEG